MFVQKIEHATVKNFINRIGKIQTDQFTPMKKEFHKLYSKSHEPYYQKFWFDFNNIQKNKVIGTGSSVSLTSGGTKQ